MIQLCILVRQVLVSAISVTLLVPSIIHANLHVHVYIVTELYLSPVCAHAHSSVHAPMLTVLHDCISK